MSAADDCRDDGGGCGSRANPKLPVRLAEQTAILPDNLEECLRRGAIYLFFK